MNDFFWRTRTTTTPLRKQGTTFVQKYSPDPSVQVIGATNITLKIDEVYSYTIYSYIV